MSEKEKVEEFTKKFVAHGLSCGEQIGAILKKRHPKAQIFSLYRSAIAIEFDEQERIIKIFGAGDPHAWGKDLITKNIDEEEFFIIGNRFGPFIHKIVFGKAVTMSPNRR